MSLLDFTPCNGSDELLNRIKALNVKDQHQYVGSHRVIRTLGKGSFGVVKLCVGKDDTEVAIKVMTKGELKNNPSQRKMMETEINILKAITHPYVCKVYQVDDTSEETVMVMEYLRGGELYDLLLKQGKLTMEEVTRFFGQTFCAVFHLHNQMTYHRDLKLENLLLDGRGTVKLCDFGFAWRASTVGERIATECGSPHYAAPEVIRKEMHLPCQAEVWSLGVVLFVLATSSLPFDGPTPSSTLSLVLSATYKMPPDTPLALAALIKSMLVLNPKERISLSEIIDDPWFSQKLQRMPVETKQAVENEVNKKRWT